MHVVVDTDGAVYTGSERQVRAYLHVTRARRQKEQHISVESADSIHRSEHGR